MSNRNDASNKAETVIKCIIEYDCITAVRRYKNVFQDKTT